MFVVFDRIFVIEFDRKITSSTLVGERFIVYDCRRESSEHELFILTGAMGEREIFFSRAPMDVMRILFSDDDRVWAGIWFCCPEL